MFDSPKTALLVVFGAMLVCAIGAAVWLEQPVRMPADAVRAARPRPGARPVGTAADSPDTLPRAA